MGETGNEREKHPAFIRYKNISIGEKERKEMVDQWIKTQ